MNVGDKMNIIDDANAFLFTIWLNELRGIHWEEHWAYNDEPFTANWIVSKKVDDNIYLKSIVSIRGKFVAD
jgi:hypothetical protein